MSEPYSADEQECPVCNGTGFLLGIMGFLAHWRCRDCGWDFSTDTRTHDEPVGPEWLALRDRRLT